MNDPSDRTNELSSDDPRQVVGDWLEAYGNALFAYVRSRVATTDIAEDLIQETFLAALRNFHTFQGKSAPQTWLTAILRHKIIEHYRRRVSRKESTTDRERDNSPFDSHGIWRIPVGPWPQDPSQTIEDEDFWRVFEKCLGKLPPVIAEAFMLRVLDGLEASTICNDLDISASNLAVRLHRARLALRDCLGKHWFGDD